jgi:hypothetical protein
MLNQAITGAFGNELTTMCDFSNIGIVGHSLGGMMASHACRCDKRVKVGISLDGPLYGPHATEPFSKPFLFMRTSNYYESTAAAFDDNLFQMLGMTKDTFIGSIERFCQANGKDTIQIVVNGSTHNTFSDESILSDFISQIIEKSIDLSMLGATQVLPLPEMLNTIRGSIVVFLNQHLKKEIAAYPSQVQHDPTHEDFDFYVPGPPEHKEIEINPTLFNAYVGQYKFLDIDAVGTITQQENKFYAQMTGQPQVQIYPESETDFFLKVVDVQISFVKNDRAQVTRLILHQGGTDLAAEKIK